MVKTGKWIAKHRVIILMTCILLFIPSVFGMAATKINYDLLSYLPERRETQSHYSYDLHFVVYSFGIWNGSNEDKL